MKFLSKLIFALALLAGLILGLWASTAKAVQAPQSNSSITNPPYGPIFPKTDNISTNQTKGSSSRKLGDGDTGQSYGGWHSTRANIYISSEKLQLFLGADGAKSPLAPFSEQILRSPYWSTIIGICTIEQYGCTRAPGNNYWGIMCGGKVCRYETLADGIQAISNLLAKYESKDKDTIEELNGYYVVPASNNWLNTVLKTKQALESL